MFDVALTEALVLYQYDFMDCTAAKAFSKEQMNENLLEKP